MADDGGRPAEALQADDLAHRYLWGPAVDQILADEQVQSCGEAGQVVWPLADPIGTVRDLVPLDAETVIVEVANYRVYDSFGNLQSQTNAAVDCLFGFTVRPFDTATGLQNNWNRWYDPRLTRWASEDPIGLAGGDGKLHKYCSNSPVHTIDPAGLDDWSLWPSWLDRTITLDELERMIKAETGKKQKELKTAKKILNESKRLGEKGDGIRGQRGGRGPGGGRCVTPFDPLDVLIDASRIRCQFSRIG